MREKKELLLEWRKNVTHWLNFEKP
jgi:hypothetical protein